MNVTEMSARRIGSFSLPPSLSILPNSPLFMQTTPTRRPVNGMHCRSGSGSGQVRPLASRGVGGRAGACPRTWAKYLTSLLIRLPPQSQNGPSEWRNTE